MTLPQDRESRATGRRAYSAAVLVLAALCVPYSIIAYNWTNEDLFITLRYVRNLIEGHGLIFNPLEPADRVEGYSNLLWTLLLAMPAKAGFNLDVSARLLAAACLGGVVMAVAFFRRTGDGSPPRTWLDLFAPLAILAQPTLHYLTDSGLETNLFAGTLCVAAAAVVRRRHAAASLALGIAALTRPEGLIYWFCWLPVIWRDVREADPRPGRDGAAAGGLSPRAKIAAAYAIPWLAVLTILLNGRFQYYGMLLPNTVFAKHPGWGGFPFRLSRLWDFSVATSHLPVTGIIATGFLLWSRHGRALRRESAVAALGFLVTVVFGVAASKAPERLRYMAPAIPFVVLVLQLGVIGIHDMQPRRRHAAGWVIAAALLVMNFVQLENFDTPDSRLHERTARFLANPDPESRWRWYVHEPVHLNWYVGEWIDGNLPSDAVVGADQVGMLGFRANRTVIDLLGLCDRVVWKNLHWPRSILQYLQIRRVDHLALLLWDETGADFEHAPPAIEYIRWLALDPKFPESFELTHVLRSRFKPAPWAFGIYARRESGRGETTGVQTLFLGPASGKGDPSGRD